MMALLTGTLYDSGCLVAWKQSALPAGRDERWTPQAAGLMRCHRRQVQTSWPSALSHRYCDEVVEESFGVAVADPACGVLREPHKCPVRAAVPQSDERRAVGGGTAGGEFEGFVGAVLQAGEPVEHLVFDPADHRRPAVAEREDAFFDSPAGSADHDRRVRGLNGV